MDEYEPSAEMPTTNRPIFEIQNLDRVKVILVNLPAYDYSLSPYRGIPHIRRPPIGLYSIKFATEIYSGENSIQIIDMEEFRLAPVDLADIISKIERGSKKNLIIGINGYSPNRFLVERVLKYLTIYSETWKIIVGGRLVSIELDPRKTNYITPEDSLISNIKPNRNVYFFVGEAEASFIHLLKNINWEELNLSSVGSVNRNNIKFPVQFEILKKDVLEFGHKQMPPKYLATEGHGQYYYAMISSRSCAYSCSFCAANYFPVRIREIAILRAQIETLCKINSNAAFIDFFDDNVFQSPNRGREIVEMMEGLHNSGYSVIWRALARADTIMKMDLSGHIARAAAAGLEEVAIGVESVSDQVLSDMSKGLTFGVIDAAINNLEKCHIRAKMFVMIGSRNETIDEALATINYIKKRSKNGNRWSLFIKAPYAGTEDHNNLLKNGYTFWDLQLYTEAASRGGSLVNAVDDLKIQLGKLPLGELFSMAQEGNSLIFNATVENLGEDCCAVAFENQKALGK